MACNESKTYGPQNVWTKRSDTNWLAHAMGAPESTDDSYRVRAAMENRSSSGGIKTRIVFRTSNDGSTWGNWTALYTSPAGEQANDGTKYPDDYVDLTNSVKGQQLIQWGCEAINSVASATTTELCVVTLKIDKKAA